MASTLLIHHPCFLQHVTAPGHPERVDRLHAVHQVLESDVFDDLRWVEAPEGDLAAARAVHSNAHVDLIEAKAPALGAGDLATQDPSTKDPGTEDPSTKDPSTDDTGAELVYLDRDTMMSPGSLNAARHALGGALHAVDEVMMGGAQNAFCAMRPPGHHAESERAMGFCLFNTIAAAARHAQNHHGAERVAIFDFDVHHGNGTQEIFWDAPDVVYASTHQMPLYPGSGDPQERGAHDSIVNVKLGPGSGSDAFRAAVSSVILPSLERAAPDILLLSAGFDAHYRDPLANLALTEDDFAWVTTEVMALADKRCGGRIVSILEGGYDLQGLSRSVAAHVGALMVA